MYKFFANVTDLIKVGGGVGAHIDIFRKKVKNIRINLFIEFILINTTICLRSEEAINFKN